MATDGGDIRGVLPLLWTGDDGARVYNSLPFYGSHGSVLADDAGGGGGADRRLRRRARRPQARSPRRWSPNPFAERQPPEPAHNLTDERISQVTELPGRTRRRCSS